MAQSTLSRSVIPLAVAVSLVVFVFSSHLVSDVISQNNACCFCVKNTTVGRSVQYTNQSIRTQNDGQKEFINPNKSIWELPSRDMINFSKPCDVGGMIVSLYDRTHPLTSADLERLAGCMALFYFRSPRCGSTAIVYLLHKMAAKLNFTSGFVKMDNPQNNITKWHVLIGSMLNKREPFVRTGHVRALDIVSGADKPPVIFNVIRDPISHILSTFKLKKYGARQKAAALQGDINPKCNMSADDFLHKYGVDSRCTNEQFLGLRYLCGECPQCSRRECLQRAKTNLDKVYLTVGLTQNIPAFLMVMETMLPQFFKGALRTYMHMSGLYQIFSQDDNRNETFNETSIAILKRELGADIELYSYIQTRFDTSLRKVIEYRTESNLTGNKCLFESADPTNMYTKRECVW